MDEGIAIKTYIIKVMDSISSAIYSLFSAFDQNKVRNAHQCIVGKRILTLTDHNNDVLEGGVCGKGFDAVSQHRFPANLAVLLGNVAADTGSRPCGNDDRG